MKILVKELRNSTGLSQQAFARQYGIPVSTLRKWEQGEASPPAYVLQMLSRMLPGADQTLITITGHADKKYFYNKNKNTVLDALGNEIMVEGDLELVHPQNLAIYLEGLFDDFYSIQKRFDEDCRMDQEENIIWTRKGNG